MSWGDKHGALLDRMSIVHVETKNIRILDYVTGKILPESLMYAIVDIVRNRNVDTECRSNLSGRLKRHSCAIQRAALKLNITIEPHIADDIVLCGWSTALDMYGNMNRQQLYFYGGLDMLKPIKYLIRIIRETNEAMIYTAGKKDSIIRLCREGKLQPRKCRKYPY